MQGPMTMPPMDAQGGAAASGVGILLFVAIALVFSLVYVIPFFFIFKKVGWHWALGFLMLISPVNLVLLYVLAFVKWPIEQRQAPDAAPAPPA